jgi:hypothetical protein
MNPRPPKRPFSLLEYEHACSKFVYTGVYHLMEAKDEVWGSIPRVVRSEAVPVTQNTMLSGEVVQNQPMEILTRYVFTFNEIRSCDKQAFATQMDNAADQTLSVVMPRFFEMIRRTSDAAGTAIDVGGRPFTFEVYLEMLARVQIDFDNQGKPDLPQLVMGPEMARRLHEQPPPTQNQLERFAALIEKKRKEHNDRRRCRKLR